MANNIEVKKRTHKKLGRNLGTVCKPVFQQFLTWSKQLKFFLRAER